MRRLAKIVSTQPLRKAVSVAVRRPAGAAFAAADEESAASSGAVLPRVRDGLVLRVIAKKKSIARSQPDEHLAR